MMKRVYKAKEMKNDLIRKGIIVTSVGLAFGGVYCSGYNKANEVHDSNIRQSNINQEITQTELQGTKIDAMIDSINTKLQIVLLEQNETANLKLEKQDAK